MTKEELDNKIKEISKWPEPDSRAGEGGPGPLYTSGLLTQYKYDKEKHERQMTDVRELLIDYRKSILDEVNKKIEKIKMRDALGYEYVNLKDLQQSLKELK